MSGQLQAACIYQVRLSVALTFPACLSATSDLGPRLIGKGTSVVNLDDPLRYVRLKFHTNPTAYCSLLSSVHYCLISPPPHIQ